MTSSPIWRSGGRAFPASPKDNYTHKVNRKAYRAGMQTILSELVRQERIAVVEDFKVDSPKLSSLYRRLMTLDMLMACYC